MDNEGYLANITESILELLLDSLGMRKCDKNPKMASDASSSGTTVAQSNIIFALGPMKDARLANVVDTGKGKGPFEGFPRLPREVQDEIWKLSLPGPRVIEVKLENSGPVGGLAYKASFEPISNMYASRGSRLVALRKYRLSFAAQLYHPIYFDPARDVLMIGRTVRLMAFLTEKGRGKTICQEGVQRLVVDPITSTTRRAEPWTTRTRGDGWIAEQLNKTIMAFASLQELILISRRGSRQRLARIMEKLKPIVETGND